MRRTIFPKIKVSIFLMVAILVLSEITTVLSQEYPDRTVGLIKKDSLAFEGYTLFAPMSDTTTYLINNDGLFVHSWKSNYIPGESVYLLEDGKLLRTAKVDNLNFNQGGGLGGRVQLIDWDGTIVWDYLYSGSNYCQHHDVGILPNGNVLIIAWEYKSTEEAIAEGRSPDLLKQNKLWTDSIIEVKPDSLTKGEIVWEWHVWDHMIQDYDSTKFNYGVVADHPELIDLNFVKNGPNAGNADWNHTNSVAYNEEFDQIMLSVHNFNEIWVIDHSTTTEEAAGHSGGNSGKGGDILYRWGNPQTYDAGDQLNMKLFGQHDAHWIKSGCPGHGNILFFNNGNKRKYSTVEEIVPPVSISGNYSLTIGSAYGPENQYWIYSAKNPTDFLGKNLSSAQRLPNGNTLICNGPDGIFFEVTSNNDIVWYYVNPVGENGPLTQGSSTLGTKNMVFKIRRYAPNYPGLAGRDLSPGEPIEIYPSKVENYIEQSPAGFMLEQNYPNPFNSVTRIPFSLLAAGHVVLSIYDINGRKLETLINGNRKAGKYTATWSAGDMPTGIYLCRLITQKAVETRKILLVK